MLSSIIYMITGTITVKNCNVKIVSNCDWIGLSCHLQIELSAVFGVDVNCQLLRKDTGVPQYNLY